MLRSLLCLVLSSLLLLTTTKTKSLAFVSPRTLTSTRSVGGAGGAGSGGGRGRFAVDSKWTTTTTRRTTSGRHSGGRRCGRSCVVQLGNGHLPALHHFRSRRSMRKRDVLIRKWGSIRDISPAGCGRLRLGSSWRRRMTANDDDEDEEEKPKTENDVAGETTTSNNSTVIMMIKPLVDKVDEIKVRYEETVAAIVQYWEEVVLPKIPLQVREWFVGFVKAVQNAKLVAFGFVAGAVLAAAAILVPIYQSVETLTQPVTLFETILGDLEQAYVDPVDTQQLFETGMAAMLRSLDPYTEFEDRQAATALTETIDGKYGGVGLVIATSNKPPAKSPDAADKSKATTTTSPSAPSSLQNTDSKLLPRDAQEDNVELLQDEETDDEFDGVLESMGSGGDYYDDDDNEDVFQNMAASSDVSDNEEVPQNDGIRVVSALEGYAYDYGMRVGDELKAVDSVDITPTTTVEEVRNVLRGEPGTLVTIRFVRNGVEGVQSVTMPRSVVRLRDVKLATLLGNPASGMGYIQLTGFAANAGGEVRNAIRALQAATEQATAGEGSLRGLILDLRGNPGGLLTSAVDVASLLVPKGSDIVAAKGRGFPGILYRSRVDPILDTSGVGGQKPTKLAVLVNGNTASAAEIVTGAVQDLDVGVVVGQDRTFGKGLVQNVEDLPFDTALKFTVAKYYTPSGRCIQGINYKEGDRGKYVANKVQDKDRAYFFTKRGRQVRDGGGIEADFKVAAPKASALEVTLLRSGVLQEFAAEWSKTHEFPTDRSFVVDEDLYKQFQAFVRGKQKRGDLQLESLYATPLADLKKQLTKAGYKGSAAGVEHLQASILQEVQKDFEKYRADIKEDISQTILARYLPESMLIERGVKTDRQVRATIRLLQDDTKFERILAGNTAKSGSAAAAHDVGGGGTINLAATTKNGPIVEGNDVAATSSDNKAEKTDSIRATIQW